MSAELFDFESPPGYAVIEADLDLDKFRRVATSFNDRQAIIGIAFNIDRRAILLCWAYVDRTGEIATEPGLHDEVNRAIMSAGPADLAESWRFDQKLLRVDSGKDHHWRWSLLVPSEGDAFLGDVFYNFAFDAGEGDLYIVLKPLYFDDGFELADLIEQVQALTLAADPGPHDVITLERIRSLIPQQQPQ